MDSRTEDELNETTQLNDVTAASPTEAESLDDLPVEDDEQVKGGLGGYNCSVSGLGLGNHNETMNADADE